MNNFLIYIIFARIIPVTFLVLVLALILNILFAAWVRIQDKLEPPRKTLDQQMKAYLDARRKAGLPAWEDEPEQHAERPALSSFDSEINRIEWGDWSAENELLKAKL